MGFKIEDLRIDGKCPKCGKEVDNMPFCKYCGTSLTKLNPCFKIACPVCGKNFGGEFCPKHGERYEKMYYRGGSKLWK